jgi:hypothetical protein
MKYAIILGAFLVLLLVWKAPSAFRGAGASGTW